MNHLQAFNWLLRSVSQPACLHDLLWCFVSVLEANSPSSVTSLSPVSSNDPASMANMNSNDDKKDGNKKLPSAASASMAASQAAAAINNTPAHPSCSKKGEFDGLFDHPSEDISIAGEAIQPLPSIFHGLLQTVSDLMLLLPIGTSLQQIAITCWCIKFRPQDHNFLHQSHVFSTISKILSRYVQCNFAPFFTLFFGVFGKFSVLN